MNWFLIDTEFGDTLVDLDEVIFIRAGYHYDEGWADEARCHIYPIHLYMRNGQDFTVDLNQRGYEALLSLLKVREKS